MASNTNEWGAGQLPGDTGCTLPRSLGAEARGRLGPPWRWPPSPRPTRGTGSSARGAPARAAARRPCAPLTLQVHLVQLSTTQVSFSAKNLPSCQQADMFLVLGGPPMSSQRNWLSFDCKEEGKGSAQPQHGSAAIVHGRMEGVQS